jgi:uncharacterized glyoxalase superfamily protein PhnB
MLTVSQTLPVFRIFDVGKAVSFYVDYLGFAVDWEHRFEPGMPAYMQVTLGGLSLHLSEHHGDCCPGGSVFVWTTGLDAYYETIRRKDYKYLRPGVEETFYGARCLKLLDPFGNKILLNEKIESAS